MKKKILSLVAIAAIGLGVWSYNVSQNSMNLSALVLENVEALAEGEGTAVGNCMTNGTGEAMWAIECDSSTNDSMIYPCEKSKSFINKGNTTKCTSK